MYTSFITPGLWQFGVNKTGLNRVASNWFSCYRDLKGHTDGRTDGQRDIYLGLILGYFLT